MLQIKVIVAFHPNIIQILPVNSLPDLQPS